MEGLFSMVTIFIKKRSFGRHVFLSDKKDY